VVALRRDTALEITLLRHRYDITVLSNSLPLQPFPEVLAIKTAMGIND